MFQRRNIYNEQCVAGSVNSRHATFSLILANKTSSGLAHARTLVTCRVATDWQTDIHRLYVTPLIFVDILLTFSKIPVKYLKT